MLSISDYRLYRLEFETPVRFGSGKGAAGLDKSEMALSSDSLFSAISLEWLSLFGLESMQRMILAAKSGQMMLSSLMPWQQPVGTKSQPEYYLPRPLLSGKIPLTNQNSQVKKQLKQVPWIAATAMSEYLRFVQAGEGSPLDFQATFGIEVAWDRVNTRSGNDPLPYRVSAFQFNRGQKTNQLKKESDKLVQQSKMVSGLYLITAVSDQDLQKQFVTVLESIGHSGIGGKTSSGLGKYIIWDDCLDDNNSSLALKNMIRAEEAPVQMLISTVVPETDHDIDIIRKPESRYLLVKREGFTASASFCDPETGRALKRKCCILLKEGSCFPSRLRGSVVNLSYDGLHPVYRSGLAMHMGLNL